MTIDELKEKRQSLSDEIDGATAERFEQIKEEIASIDQEIAEETKRSSEVAEAEKAEEEERAARLPNEPDNNLNKVINLNNEKRGVKKMTKEEERKLQIASIGASFRKAKEENKTIEINLRAESEAVTTTDKTYVAPSAEVDGTNNGGVFIPTQTLFDLLGETEIASPIYNGVSKTNFKGVLVFPYRKDRKANSVTKKEREKVDELSIEWEKFKLTDGDYALSVGITFEILNQADYALGEYLINQVRDVINETVVPDVIYGTGENEHIAGLVLDAVDGEYTAGEELEAIHTALDTLSRKYQAGARIYLSTTLYNELSFKVDSTGRPLYPLFNQGTIATIAGVEVVKDPFLHDGDFVYGNPTRYHLNETAPATVYSEVHGRDKIVEYTVHEMLAGRAEPEAFYYGHVKSSN